MSKRLLHGFWGVRDSAKTLHPIVPKLTCFTSIVRNLLGVCFITICKLHNNHRKGAECTCIVKTDESAMSEPNALRSISTRVLLNSPCSRLADQEAGEPILLHKRAHCESPQGQFSTNTRAYSLVTFCIRMRAIRGTANASVFPEPVFAIARQSRPAAAAGHTIAWMGVGAWYPASLSACTTCRLHSKPVICMHLERASIASYSSTILRN